MDTEWEPTFPSEPSTLSGEHSYEVTSRIRDSLREGLTEALSGVLTEARTHVESLGVDSRTAGAATSKASVDAYRRSRDLIAEFVEAEVYPADGLLRVLGPPPFAEAFATELDRADARMGEPAGQGGSARHGGVSRIISALGIAKLVAYGFAACAINQQQCREAGEAALEPAAGLRDEDIHRVWLERIDDEHKRLLSDHELELWLAHACSPAFVNFFTIAGGLGVIDLGSGEALADSFLIFYSTVGWTLYLANTPLWHVPLTEGDDRAGLDRDAPEVHDDELEELSSVDPMASSVFELIRIELAQMAHRHPEDWAPESTRSGAPIMLLCPWCGERSHCGRDAFLQQRCPSCGKPIDPFVFRADGRGAHAEQAPPTLGPGSDGSLVRAQAGWDAACGCCRPATSFERTTVISFTRFASTSRGSPTASGPSRKSATCPMGRTLMSR
jgi:hypothetical protein